MSGRGTHWGTAVESTFPWEMPSLGFFYSENCSGPLCRRQKKIIYSEICIYGRRIFRRCPFVCHHSSNLCPTRSQVYVHTRRVPFPAIAPYLRRPSQIYQSIPSGTLIAEMRPVICFVGALISGVAAGVVAPGINATSPKPPIVNGTLGQIPSVAGTQPCGGNVGICDPGQCCSAYGIDILDYTLSVLLMRSRLLWYRPSLLRFSGLSTSILRLVRCVQDTRWSFDPGNTPHPERSRSIWLGPNVYRPEHRGTYL